MLKLKVAVVKFVHFNKNFTSVLLNLRKCLTGFLCNNLCWWFYHDTFPDKIIPSYNEFDIQSLITQTVKLIRVSISEWQKLKLQRIHFISFFLNVPTSTVLPVKREHLHWEQQNWQKDQDGILKICNSVIWNTAGRSFLLCWADSCGRI